MKLTKRKANAIGVGTGLLLLLMIVIHGFPSPNDPYFTKQWAQQSKGSGMGIHAEKMWQISKRSPMKRDVTVAIIDTGVSFQSNDLAGTQWKNDDEIMSNHIDDDHNGYVDDDGGWSFVDNAPFKESQVESYHGTMCASIITAKHNGYGLEGVARNIDIHIMPIKALSSENSFGEGSIKNLVKSIRYADENGADICNLSLNTDQYDRALYDAIHSSKMLFVVAAGNNNNFLRINIDKNKLYPASFDLPNVITVANMNEEGVLDQTSNYGPGTVDLAAPGANICCTTGENDFGYVTGTSFAAPFVTGVASQIYANKSDITAIEAKHILCDAVTKTKSLQGKCKTGGRLSRIRDSTRTRKEGHHAKNDI